MAHGERRSSKTAAPEDLTARARIRQAAIHRFAAEGISKAKLKDIAADAGVTTPLITHHFGSKDGLRTACDEYLAEQIRLQKELGLSAPGKPTLDLIREHNMGTSLIGYLARTLAAGGPHTDVLVDRMIADAKEYTHIGVESGIIRDTPKLAEYVTVMTIWQLGAMVLHEHVRRHLDIDLIDNDAGSAIRWAQLAGEILSDPIMLVDADTLMGLSAEEDSPTPDSKDTP